MRREPVGASAACWRATAGSSPPPFGADKIKDVDRKAIPGEAGDAAFQALTINVVQLSKATVGRPRTGLGEPVSDCARSTMQDLWRRVRERVSNPAKATARRTTRFQ